MPRTYQLGPGAPCTQQTDDHAAQMGHRARVELPPHHHRSHHGKATHHARHARHARRDRRATVAGRALRPGRVGAQRPRHPRGVVAPGPDDDGAGRAERWTPRRPGAVLRRYVVQVPVTAPFFAAGCGPTRSRPSLPRRPATPSSPSVGDDASTPTVVGCAAGPHDGLDRVASVSARHSRRPPAYGSRRCHDGAMSGRDSRVVAGSGQANPTVFAAACLCRLPVVRTEEDGSTGWPVLGAAFACACGCGVVSGAFLLPGLAGSTLARWLVLPVRPAVRRLEWSRCRGVADRLRRGGLPGCPRCWGEVGLAEVG